MLLRNFKAWQPDLIVVAAFGQIFAAECIEIYRRLAA